MNEEAVAHVPSDPAPGARRAGPFRPGELPLFIGGRVEQRSSILTWLQGVVDRATSSALLLYGARGTGKTTLAGYLAEQTLDTGWTTVPLRGDIDTTFVGQIAALAQLPPERTTKWTFGIDVKVVSATLEKLGQPESLPLPELVATIVESELNGLMLIVDEAQAAAQVDLAALSAVLEVVADRRQLPVGVALLGTEKLVSVVGPGQGSLGRLHRADHVILPVRQSLAETRDICTGTLVDYPGISAPAIAAIHDDTGGFPHAIQVYGQLAFEAASGDVIDSGHVAAVRDDVLGRLGAQVFQMMWQRQGVRGRRPSTAHDYLLQIANGHTSHSRIAELLDKPPTSLTQPRHDLIARGVLVATRPGEVGFAIPMMAEWVRDRMG